MKLRATPESFAQSGHCNCQQRSQFASTACILGFQFRQGSACASDHRNGCISGEAFEMSRAVRRSRVPAPEGIPELKKTPKTSIQYRKLQASSLVTAAAVARFTDARLFQLVIFKEVSCVLITFN